MSEKLIIYGFSDDLIEIDGSIQKEITLSRTDCGRIHLDDRQIDVLYGKDGEWFFTVRNKGPFDDIEHLTSNQDHECSPDYSETVIIKTPETIENIEFQGD